MQYPLREKIGNPDLLVGRAWEFDNFGKWLTGIPACISKSRVIMARRKSGKTAFVQRIFNQLWSANGKVIPFYFDIPENNIWYPHFAIKYYRAFASQYISFMERDASLVREHLSLEEIREYGRAKSIKSFVKDVDFMIKENYRDGMHGLMWDIAYAAPHTFADLYEQRVLVIIDEFQNIAQYIYPDQYYQTAPIKTLPGSFHSIVESKIAPMLVTGSYVGWLIEISGKYLQGGRLSPWRMSPYLTTEEGLQAVYKYAEVYQEPLTNETAFLINRLCMSDPFLISCVIQSNLKERDLTDEKGVFDAFNYEINDRDSIMSKTWSEYIQLTLHKINDRYAKEMLLFLSKHCERYWTPQELKKMLNIDLDLDTIKAKLMLLVGADVIEWGSSDIDFRGLRDGTLNLILRNRFEKEIKGSPPDLKQESQDQIKALQKEKQQLQGKLNNLSGKFAEYQLATTFRTKKRFALSYYFSGSTDTTLLNIINVKQRIPLQRINGKNMELDLIAESECGRVLMVEVKKRKEPVSKNMVEDFIEKVKVYAEQNSITKPLPAFLSLGGFTKEAMQFCEHQGICTAEYIAHF